MAILFGLAAAVSYGLADFIAREASHREGSLKTLLYLQLVGGFMTAVLVPLAEPLAWGRVFSPAGLVAVLIGLEFVGAAALLYRALAAGPLLIVSPIISSFAAVTVVLSLLSGERPGTAQATGMLVTLAGVVLAATAPGNPEHEERSISDNRRLAGLSIGVSLAIASALLIGVGAWLERFIVPVLGSGTTVLMMRLTGLVTLAAYFLASRNAPGLRSAGSLRWLLPIGVLDTGANWFYTLGLASGLTSIVAVITSLSGVATVILGFVISRERITRVQLAGILTTFAGVALVSL